MDLRLQPKPVVEISPADKGVVSRKQFFVKKKFEKINEHFFAAHLIRDWRPKAELIYPQIPDESVIQYECDFNREVQNCFVEDYAEEVFLRTPPPCFVVFGKFKNDVHNLCEKLADEYGSVLIQVDNIVNQVLERNTDTSQIVERLLRLGVSLTLNFILALLSYVAHTPEARHRGYVLSGLPCLPLSYDLPVEQQFHYIFSWDNKPTFFINVSFDDEDLIKERTSSRVRFIENGNDKRITYYTLPPQRNSDDDDETDVDDEMLPIKEDPPAFEPDVNIPPSRQLAYHPRDDESRVWYEFEQFDNIIKPVIELISSRVDPQYFITIDSRVHNEFDIVQARLKLLQVWKVPVAAPFFLPKHITKLLAEADEDEDEIEDDEEEDEDNETDLPEYADEPPQSGFLTLFSKRTISPKFRWELSHYNYICPVSLREGEIIEGKTRFAVNFMKYIYFLRDEECMAKFLLNPRAYVLPIRPKPICRFIVTGYPFSGKTTLARFLAKEFSVPLIDLKKILKNDLLRKKNTYEEFCQQKAQCREVIRLTALAWQDWRVEEERRIALIEQWILYIQNLLNKRIQQFYSGDLMVETPVYPSLELQPPTPVSSTGNFETEGEGSEKLEESHGKQIPQASQSTSDKEANLFFSSLWNSFSAPRWSEIKHLPTKYPGEDAGESVERSEFGEDQTESDEDYDAITVDWCQLLPPQSLSSLMLSRKPYTTREKRNSFKIFLDAASKAYWVPSALKTEFAKWRLPCFMDIPLCEIFLENPILLLKYVPEWLKERPLIPDPIDPSHPSVVEAGRQALLRAQVVNIKQTQEEVGILLCHAIEKAEREGMRVTGEVISPGGWVVDNMSLEMEVWNKLACENVFASHVYALIDTEPDYRRILKLWCQECGIPEVSEETSVGSLSGESDENPNFKSEKLLTTMNQKSGEILSPLKNISAETLSSIIHVLIESVKAIREGNTELDAIFRSLLNTDVLPEYLNPLSMSEGSPKLIEEKTELALNLPMENFAEDTLSLQSVTDTIIFTTAFLGQGPQGYPASWNVSLGEPLETVTNFILDFFKEKPRKESEDVSEQKYLECGLEFFYFLLTLPKKLEQLKGWFDSLGNSDRYNEIVMTEKTPEAILSEIKNKLMEPFIKKPRELEDFEIEEIKASGEEEMFNWEGDSERDESLVMESDIAEDLRIFGEAGPLCIVNLERDIYLRGKLEYALRYYGKLYYFWNEDAKNKFIEDPEKYAPYYSAIRCYPPLRIFVTGPVGSGKTTVASSLSQHCGIPIVEYPTLLFKSLVPHASLDSLNLLTDQKLLLSDDHNAAAKQAKELFLGAPYEKRKFLTENTDKDALLNELKEFRRRESFQTPPELVFACIESISEEELQGEDSGSKYELSVPQAPYASMEEIETIITNYINNSSDLNDYCVEKSFKTLWTSEPYIREGFVLDNFPIRSYDVKTIIDNNWIPDLVIELELSENEVIKRNINNLMDLWDTKLKQETIEEKAMEETLISINNALMMIRKSDLFDEKRTEFDKYQASDFSEIQKPSLESVHSNLSGSLTSKTKLKKQEFSDSQMKVVNENTGENGFSKVEEEIEEILNKEFPPLEFNPIFETYDAGRARIIENIIKAYRRDSGEIAQIKANLKELGVPWLEIDALKNSQEILTDLFIRLDKIRKRSLGKGEFAFTLTMEMAEKLLEQGYYFLSKFGRWCPVQVYRMKNPIHMFRPFSVRGKVTPIAYRNYIYFVAGENEKVQFLEDPIKYTFNEPHHPNIPLRVAVIGPPKSGKSTLSTRLGIMFDLKVITMGSALRFVLEKAAESRVARSINSYLKRGCFLPLSLKMEALMICLNDPACYTQGFVLDGIPFDAALTQSLAEKGKLPFVIISLVADPYFGKTNREALDLQQFRLPYKNRINLDARYLEWSETYQRFAQWNQDTYSNLYELNAKLNVVDIFYQAYDIIRKSFFGILYYVEYCISGRVLPLHYLCVSQHEYELRKSSFQNNCPVCWVEKSRLCSETDPPPRSGLVQYGNHFYWICPEHMEKFVINPKAYFFPHAPKWPENLPVRLNEHTATTKYPDKIHGNGRCPVTRIDFPSSLDWEGSWNYAAFYEDEVFLCKNENMLKRFLAQPWRYYKADTKFEVNRLRKSKAIENLGPPKITSLPPIGFLEQTVANLIHDSLRLLGNVRPIYPNMPPSVTGCIFVALYLKVYNKRNKMPHLERRYLNFMLESCAAYSFKVKAIRPTEQEIGQGDYDLELSEDSDNSDESDESCNSLPCHSFAGADGKMWSAKKINPHTFPMQVTSDNELVEVKEHPKVITILMYDTSTLRVSPIPPVRCCVNFLYSITQPVKLPEKFNYNYLYQPLPPFSALFEPTIRRFNPEKKFSIMLYEEEKPEFRSATNLYKGQRTLSDGALGGIKIKPQSITDPQYREKRFLPRFQLYEKLVFKYTPATPEPLPDIPVVYNPHRDYSYMLLLSEFFGVTHVLRSFELNQYQNFEEFTHRTDDTLGLTDARIEYIFKPKITPSERSWLSLDSYQQIFDAATSFAVGSPDLESGDQVTTPLSPKSSTFNFIKTLLFEKLDELFDQYCSMTSYDSFETVVSTRGDSVEIREVLPYPPLTWDIASRPYSAYRAINAIFKKQPVLDWIAHERHFSLLDGLMEQEKIIRYLKIPPKQPSRVGSTAVLEDEEKYEHYFHYDFFNIPWSSFLAYPHSKIYSESEWRWD